MASNCDVGAVVERGRIQRIAYLQSCCVAALLGGVEIYATY